MVLNNNFEIKIATTIEERFAAYRLRYQVFTEEENDYRYADSEKNIYTDTFDNDMAVLIVCKNGLKVIGTSRLVFRKFGPYIGDHLLKYDTLASINGISVTELIEKTMIRSRTVIDKKYRNMGIFSNMVALGENICREQNICFAITVIDTHKIKVKKKILN